MEEPQYNEVAEQVGVHNALQQGTALANQNRQLQYQMEDIEKNLAEAQLDCEETLNKINHLLRQDILKLGDEQILEWFAIDDEKKRVLTDEGVERIMQVMVSYINKESLLSNFDDKTIMRRMLEFSLALNSLLFLKYEIFFRTPSIEECQTILKERIDKQIDVKKVSLKILGEEVDEKQIKKEILARIENRIEYEVGKIKSEKTKLNLREFEMIFVQLKALVEATHNRAWKGEERGSLRRHFNISEVIGGQAQMPEKKRGGGFFGLK